MTDREVKLRMEDLLAVLQCIAVKRPEVISVTEQAGLSSFLSVAKMQELQALYSFIGSSAPHYIKAIQALTSQRVGNVARIRPDIERRQKRRGEAA